VAGATIQSSASTLDGSFSTPRPPSSSPHPVYRTVYHTYTMQLTTILLAGVAAVGVSATPSWMPDQVTVKEEYKVPGDNPLYFCSDPADYIVTIDKVDLDPNPPKPYVCRLPVALAVRARSAEE
jgi:hypothetical protein